MLKKKWQSPWLIGVDSAIRTAVVTSHQHHRHHLALERGLPFGGAYYWIPIPDGSWSILVFPNAFYEGGEAGHVEIWEEVIRILSGLHDLKGNELIEQIGNSPYGLPRGRVVQMGSGDWGVAHGGDHPVGTDLESTIREAFCLNEIQPKFFFDEHEQMLPGDQSLVESSLTAGCDWWKVNPADLDLDRFPIRCDRHVLKMFFERLGFKTVDRDDCFRVHCFGELHDV